MVEKITAAIAHEAFSDAVLPWALERCADGLQSNGFHRFHGLGVEDRVAVVDQVFRGCAAHKSTKNSLRSTSIL